jgi:membrane protease YdiL (CAAX protease family)
MSSEPTSETQPMEVETSNVVGHSSLLGKTAAVFEVAGVLVAGNIIAFYLIPLLGIKPLGPMLQSALKAPDPDFIPLSLGFLETKLVQYGCFMLLAFAVGWWRRRLRPRHYGITTAGRPVRNLVGLGVVVFALVALPVKLLWLARQFFALGEGSPFWVLLEKHWSLSFWVFMAVASFGFQPVIEELFFRGYCQSRLEEAFGGIGAIFIVSLFFVLGHDQYHHLSILSVGNIIALIPCTFGMAFLYWQSRSLIPGIILHAALNVPTKGIYNFLLPAAMIIIVIFSWRTWLNLVQDFCRQAVVKGWKGPAWLATLILTGIIFGFERWQSIFMPIALLCFASALLIEFRQRKSAAGRLK